ncbi:uncharacterized protein LOC106532597 [Austrofundulus limnaeus]|uniref:Uncharacterized protein LOC106532597 n=1 Tax=Austrofundulus limnaeus TaxID=52670 RepID=A0A2I4CVX1_AUSLI|nr:PREDICTED: uncharacterized protein LOC106532597 [Austrofundulus limnaeus]
MCVCVRVFLLLHIPAESVRGDTSLLVDPPTCCSSSADGEDPVRPWLDASGSNCSHVGRAPTKPEENKMQKLLFLTLICSLCGTCGVVKSSVTMYEVTENKNLTIRWNTPMKSDVTLMNMMCEFHSDHVKVLYETIQGVPVAADEQFAGRVQFDRKAPKEAEIRLHLSRVTAQDAGSYVCFLVGNYDQNAMRWRLEMTEHFLLNVTSGAELRPDCPTTAEPGSFHPTEGEKSNRIKARYRK